MVATAAWMACSRIQKRFARVMTLDTIIDFSWVCELYNDLFVFNSLEPMIGLPTLSLVSSTPLSFP